MKEFVFGTAAQFDWLEALLADGRCHVFEHCVLPPGCTPGTARLGFEKNSSVYILYIDYGIKTTVQDAKFCSLLEQGEVRFVCMQDMVEFLYALQPLFGAAAPSAGAEPDRAQATPPVAEETPSEDDVVDMAAVLEQREKREQPQLVDPEKISGPLKKHVFGQDDALNDIAELVAVHKMQKKEKILTVMLLGPTATGKSETAKSLAKILTGIYGTEYGCIEVAGSEFASSHTVNRFFGAPPGYVGHGQPTVLDPVRQNPYQIIVIDEIEKSDPKVVEGLMEAIDTGKLGMADNSPAIDLSRCILIFTSNLPIPMDKYRAAGDFERTEICRDAFTKYCHRPEISGKIANYIVYQELSPEANARIVIKFIRQELANYDIKLRSIDPALLNEFLDDLVTVSERDINEMILLMLEKHKLVVEAAGAMSLAALEHLNLRSRKFAEAQGPHVVVPILSGGNEDTVSIGAVIQKGMIARGRIMNFEVELPDKPGQLVKVATILASERANVIALDHDQFKASGHYTNAVSLGVTVETNGPDHIDRILMALREAGFQPKRIY